MFELAVCIREPEAKMFGRYKEAGEREVFKMLRKINVWIDVGTLKFYNESRVELEYHGGSLPIAAKIC